MRNGSRPISSSWLVSQDRRAASSGGLDDQRQAGRAHLATRGAQSPPQTAQARQALADRPIVHSAAVTTSGPTTSSRTLSRWTQVPDAQRARRVHPRMIGDPLCPQAQGNRCDRHLLVLRRSSRATAAENGMTLPICLHTEPSSIRDVGEVECVAQD
jgi:hypothetical protein